MSISVWLLLGVFGVAVAGALYALASEYQRRVYVRRAQSPRHGLVDGSARADARDVGRWTWVTRSLHVIGAYLPASVQGGAGIGFALERAGFSDPSARVVYAGLHVLWGLTVLSIGFVIAPRDDTLVYGASLVLALALAVFAPRALLDRLIATRQHRIRLGVPDTLDLLVVCIEAGTALDASLHRVARELGTMHPALADELTTMTRRMSAGVSRADALTTLHERTGVAELRALSTHLIQSERWGTSVAAVLRVYARDLRRKRRLLAEKRAATAGTRMLFPLALFIFPTIFIVVLGPAVLQIAAAFRGMIP